MSSQAEEFLKAHDYEGDFWPGFVDILSGIILALSFLVLVAGIIIALIFKVNATVKITEEEKEIYKYILAILEKSPLLQEAQFDIIEKARRGNELQVLIQTAQQELEDIAERTHVVRNEYPDLKRRITQEINFLENKVSELSSPPQGRRESTLAFPGNVAEGSVVNNLIQPVDKNWTVRSFSNGLLVQFANVSSIKPSEGIYNEMRFEVSKWLEKIPATATLQLEVHPAQVAHETIAKKDALARVIYLRDVIKTVRGQQKMSLREAAVEPEALKEERYGWIYIFSKK